MILRHPPSVDLADRAHRQLDDRDRAVRQMLRVENDEVRTTILVGAMGDAHQIPSTLRCDSAAWSETAFVEVTFKGRCRGVSSEDHPIWQRHFALLVGDSPQPAPAAAAEISAPEPCAFILEREARAEFFHAISIRLRPGGILASSDLASGMGTADYEPLLSVWLSVMAAANISPEALERMRAAYAKDVAILTPVAVASIIESGGFQAPVQFFQAGLLHAWFSKRAPSNAA